MVKASKPYPLAWGRNVSFGVVEKMSRNRHGTGAKIPGFSDKIGIFMKEGGWRTYLCGPSTEVLSSQVREISVQVSYDNLIERFELGAWCKKTTSVDGDCLSGKLDDPSFSHRSTPHDRRVSFTAAAHGLRAADFLYGLQRNAGSGDWDAG